jgi:hypothetical protein
MNILRINKMRNKFLYIVIILSVLWACKGYKDEKELDENPNKCTQYACPIHPDKTSMVLEKCSTCGTLMITIDSLKKNSLKRAK